jgi:hypothetical protein
MGHLHCPSHRTAQVQGFSTSFTVSSHLHCPPATVVQAKCGWYVQESLRVVSLSLWRRDDAVRHDIIHELRADCRGRNSSQTHVRYAGPARATGATRAKSKYFAADSGTFWIWHNCIKYGVSTFKIIIGPCGSHGASRSVANSEHELTKGSAPVEG